MLSKLQSLLVDSHMYIADCRISVYFLISIFLIVITSGNINSDVTDMCSKQNEENKRSIPVFVVMSEIDIHVVPMFIQ